jgi:hypothetical protein
MLCYTVFQPRHQVRDPRWAGSGSASGPSSSTLTRPAGYTTAPSSASSQPASVGPVPAGVRRAASPPQSVVDPKRPRGDEVCYISYLYKAMLLRLNYVI